MLDSQACLQIENGGALVMTKSSSLNNREVNFRLLLAGLVILMLAGPLLLEFTDWNYPELLEIIFGGSLLLFVASLVGDFMSRNSAGDR